MILTNKKNKPYHRSHRSQVEMLDNYVFCELMHVEGDGEHCVLSVQRGPLVLREQAVQK